MQKPNQPKPDMESLILSEEDSQITLSPTSLHILTKATAQYTGEEFFRQLVIHTSKVLGVKYVSVEARQGDRLVTLACSENDDLLPNFSYEFNDTPCELVLRDGVYYCKEFLKEAFPKDPYLKPMEVTSYLGVELPGPEDDPLGVFCVLHSSEMSNVEEKLALLRLFATRAAVEVERIQAQKNRERMNRELEDEVQKRTAALRRTQTDFQSIFHKAGVGIAQSDGKTYQFLMVNRRFCEILGYPESELLGKTFLEITYREDIALSKEKIQQLKKRECSGFETEKRFVRKDGNVIWCSINPSLVFDEHGEPLYFISVIQDIHLRKSLEAQLLINQTAMQTSIDAIFIVREDAGFEFINQSACRLTGYREEELLGMGVTDIDPNFPMAVFRDFWQATVVDGFNIVKTEIIGKQGTRIPLEIHVTYFTGQGQAFLCCIARDLTERNRQQQKMLINQAALQTSSDAIFLVGPDLVFDYVNQAACRMSGYSESELLQLSVTDIDANHSPEDARKLWEHIKQVGSIKLDSELLTKEKQRVPVEVQITYFNAQGYEFHCCIARDLTERKKAEAELRHTNAELLRANTYKDEFLANMSHELRTPLHGILAMTQSLTENIYGSMTEEQKEGVQLIDECGHHLLSLINDVLDLAKIEAGRRELQIESVSVATVCQTAIKMNKQPAFAKRIRLSQQINPDLTTIRADERGLKQILVNLLNNAVKFTPEGGKIGLEVDSEDENHITFTVWDTGIGIEESHLESIFVPFVQGESGLTRNYGGTGLGLGLVKKLTEMHGGTVSVTSRLGQGSRFIIRLPQLPPDREFASELGLAKKSVHKTEPQSRPEQSIRILLAEDNEINARMIRKFLEKRGHQVDVAEDGDTTLNALQQSRPDVLLLDIQMPGRNGLEVLRILRETESWQDMPVIVLTAMAMADDREKCLNAGANAYLSKPVSLFQLEAVIHEHVDS